MNKKSQKTIKELLPFYVNGSLSLKEKADVEASIGRDEGARAEVNAWEQIHAVVISQPQQDPSPWYGSA
jgi:anti-sigma-K factor RskA